jgi:adenosylcobinamide kinase/adenosylcobinamide-phosphate guanylyltransferase
MQVRLLGTGASDGWPNPWCTCASCAAAAAQGVVRCSTSALVDGRLLIEVGADAPKAAVRAGLSLADVEVVLVTHAHPDHHDVNAWMWRGWAPGRRPLTLVGPPAVLEAAQERLDDTVTTVPVRAGDVVTVGGYEVRALAAHHGGDELGPPVLYDVTGPDGARLLWATDTGRLPDETVELVRGRAYDAVLLELAAAPIPVHLDLETWPVELARLRDAGAVTDSTRVGAIHLGHGCPPPDELDLVLASWGATAPRDGDVLDLPGKEGPEWVRLGRARRVLVLGGARSGKSAHAEQLLAAEPHVTYVATAPPRPDDRDWEARVTAHVARRPEHWTTVETADVAAVLRDARGPVLVDDLGLWLTRVMDEAGAWESPDGASAVVEAATDRLVEAWAACRATAVLVAPEVGGGIVPATPAGRRFRDAMGAATARLAAVSDEVVQVVAGLPRALR